MLRKFAPAAIIASASASTSVAAARSGGVELVPVGAARNVGALRIEVASAVATEQPHTYQLTMKVENTTNRTVHTPHVDLLCKGDTAPRPFGLTGYLVPTASELPAHSKGHGVLVLYPFGVCVRPSVRFSTRQRQPGGVMRTDEVTYSLAGLA